jgi:hypothetical protein
MWQDLRDTIIIVPGVYDQDLAKRNRRGSLGRCECDSCRERDANVDRLYRSVAEASRHDGLSHADLSIPLREMRKKVRAHRDHLRACRGGNRKCPASANGTFGGKLIKARHALESPYTSAIANFFPRDNENNVAGNAPLLVAKRT